MKLRKLTLSAMGLDFLPVPQPEAQPIKCKPYTMGMERKLGAIRQQHPQWTFFRYMTEVLLHMVEFGDDWDNLSPAERLTRINNLYFPNAIYAYTMLRRDALGPIGTMPVVCPTCHNQWDYEYNLDESPIQVVDDPNDITWSVSLVDGFQWGEDTIHELTLKVPKWQAVAGIKRTNNQVTLQMELLRAYIVPPPKHGPPTLQVLDNITRKDMLAIAQAMDSHNVGIDFSIETSCPMDGTPINVAIDWGMDSFFGSSYPSIRSQT